MRTWLDEHEIGYVHIAELGGRRKKTDADLSLVGGWVQPGFRNYAGYMQTASFESGLARLETAARHQRAVMMCGEPMWWRCHRRMVSDALTVRGWEVWHILGDRMQRHTLTEFARLAGSTVIYPPLPSLRPARDLAAPDAPRSHAGQGRRMTSGDSHRELLLTLKREPTGQGRELRRDRPPGNRKSAPLASVLRCSAAEYAGSPGAS